MHLIFLACPMILISLGFKSDLSLNKSSKQIEDTGYIPKNGFVPDAKTAIKIAEAIWTPIYGKKEIESERPFEANLINHDSVWNVSGTIPKIGGYPIIRIRKSDCKILYFIHEK